MNRQCVFVFLTSFIISCNQIKQPKDLFSNLGNKNVNRTELNEVFRHYSAPEDSLKLKASHFLINNMTGLYYYDGKQLEEYYNYVKLLSRDIEHNEFIHQSFEDLYDPFSVANLNKVYDLSALKARHFINNIDMAFKVWEEQPWGKDITFEQFCEYILPFRIADEIPEYNRQEIYNRFNPILDSVRKKGGDAVSACTVLNNALKKDDWLGSDDIGFLPHLPASKLIAYRIGSCRDMTDAAVYIMRSVGIPVAVDAVEKWPYKSNSHAWNVVLNKNGKFIRFMGMEQSPGTTNKPGTKKGKVYRKTYAINPQSLAMRKGKKDIVPELFLNPRLKDVTDEYATCFNVSVPVINKQNDNNTFAYLSVCSNNRWVPVQWGNVKNDQVTFLKMEGGIVYLPTYYTSNGELKPANYPIILNQKGQVKLLKPDTIKFNQQMVLTHMYPWMPDQFRVTKLWGGRFQGANKPDFADAIDLDTVVDPMPFWNNAKITNRNTFRYARYLPASGYQTDISELEFYRSGMKLNGKIIGSNGTPQPDTNMRKVMDNDFTTRFVTRFSTGSWVGFDFGKPQQIDAVRFAAGMNAKKNIEVLPGDTYELFYWGEKGDWISQGQKVATSSTIIFNNIPSNALYLLQNTSKKLDKRIFTYEGGKQIWW